MRPVPVQELPLPAIPARPSAPRSAAGQLRKVLSSSGRPLRPDLATSIGEAFNANFSAVRIHDDPDAAASARAVGAAMYTSGTHIVIGDTPAGFDSPSGRRALAHELYHVKQQSEGPVAGNPAGEGLIISGPSDCFEQAARQAAEHIGRPAAQRGPATRDQASAPPAPPALAPAGSAVQRLAGFEVELSVPTLRQGQGLTYPGSGVPVLPDVDAFLTGGVNYGIPIGNIATPQGNIDLSTDHNVLQDRGLAVYQAIANHLAPHAPSVPYREISNLEYGTPAWDEMAAGSNAVYQNWAATIDNHAGQILAGAPQAQFAAIPNTAGPLTVSGVPLPHLHTMLGNPLPNAVQIPLNAFTSEVRWRMKVQATAGILPSGLPMLFQSQAASRPPGQHGDLAAAAQDAAHAIVNGVNALWAVPGFQAQLQQWMAAGGQSGDQDAFRGQLLLGLSYTIGNVFNQVNLLRGTDKNAVELLIKTADVGSAHFAATNWLQQNPPPAHFIQNIANWFDANVPQTNLAYWQAPPYSRQVSNAQGRGALHGNANNPVQATVDLLTRLLTGAGGVTSIGPGTPLPGNDPVSAAIGGSGAHGGQGGLPLEFRWISQRSTAPGQLWQVFQNTLTQIRDANLADIPVANQAPIRNAW